jgi:toxin CcdB
MEKFLMARFDVYANPGRHAGTTPYLLDVQSDLLEDLETRMVIPLRRLRHFPKVTLSTRLTPVFAIEGEDYLLETPKMGAVPQRVLKSPVTSLAQAQDQVTAALDFLFQGY